VSAVCARQAHIDDNESAGAPSFEYTGFAPCGVASQALARLRAGSFFRRPLPSRVEPYGGYCKVKFVGVLSIGWPGKAGSSARRFSFPWRWVCDFSENGKEGSCAGYALCPRLLAWS